jgi:hypothetical protein
VGKISKSRRLFDKESEKIYNELTTSKIFKNNKTIIDIFSLAMIKAKKDGRRQSLSVNKAGELNRYTMDNSKSFNYLLMALIVEEKGSIDILLDEEACFDIAEEYAKNGLELLKNEILTKKEGFLEDMELEMCKFYDKIFKEEKPL